MGIRREAKSGSKSKIRRHRWLLALSIGPFNSKFIISLCAKAIDQEMQRLPEHLPQPRMLLGFTPPDNARPGACHTLKTGFGRGGGPFRYPNGGVTMRTFPSDRRHSRRRHVDNTKADDA
jgi:hypothetical protein